MSNYLPIQGEHLKKLRSKYGYTQEQVADKIGCTVKTYRSWEHSKTSPDASDLISLSELYNVSTDYILGLIEEKNHDIRFIHEYTGLSESAIDQINLYLPFNPYIINNILKSEEFYSAAGELFNAFDSIYRAAAEINASGKTSSGLSCYKEYQMSKYRYSEHIMKLFDLVISADQKVIEEIEEFKRLHPGGFWVEEEGNGTNSLHFFHW